MPPYDRYAYRLHEASSVRLPYLGIGLVLLALAFFLLLMKLPTIVSVEEKPSATIPSRSIWSCRNLLAATLVKFCVSEVARGCEYDYSHSSDQTSFAA